MKTLRNLAAVMLLATMFNSCTKAGNGGDDDNLTTDPVKVGYEAIDWGRSLLSITEDNGHTIAYTYDDRGRVASHSEQYGEAPIERTYSYLEDGTMSYVNPEGSLYSNQATHIDAEFNDMGCIVKELVRKYDNLEWLLETRTYSYNEEGYLIEATQKASDYSHTFTYTWENGNLIEVDNYFNFKSYSAEFEEIATYTYSNIEAKRITFDPTLLMSDDAPVTPTVWYGKGSKMLPATRVVESYNYNTGGFVTPTITSNSYEYTLDTEGYISSMIATDQDDDPVEITFVYAQ